MKKQNNNTLVFTKNGIVELDNNELLAVSGGTIPWIWIAESLAAASSYGCAAGAGAALAYLIP